MSQAASRFGGPTATPMARAPQRMSPAPTAVPLRSNHPAVPAQVQSRAARPAIHASARSVEEPRSTPAEPTPTPAETHRAATAAAVVTDHSPADQLIAQAHEWSGSAHAEADYTRIIDACRNGRAAGASPVAHRYAAELASWAFNRRGQIKAEAGQIQEALVDFNDALRADPQRWLASHNRGLLLAQAGQFEQAFDDFTRTIQLNPKFADAYSNRAALQMVAGELEAALHDYGQAVELDPELAVAQRGYGRALHLERRLDDALRHYNEALRLAPNDAYAIAGRADLLTDLGRYAEAVDQYERSIRLDPRSDQACSSAAWLLATCPDDSVRNPARAIDLARLAIELTDGQDAVCFDALAAAQASAGDFAAATRTMQQAVQLAPAELRDVYQQRLGMYRQSKPYRIAPVGEVVQASYEEPR